MTAWMAALALGLAAAQRGPTLGIADTRFTLNGKPTFLLGMSYYGGLGASDQTVRRDLDMLKRHGFNWIRVWATWSFGDADVSAVDSTGAPRSPYMGRLVRIVEECAKRGMVVDVTLSRGRAAIGGGIPDAAAHAAAVRSVIAALKGHRNWYLDLANERDVRDARYVSTKEIRALRDLARKLEPALPVTASFGGHDLGEAYVREALIEAELDFVAPHRPRQAGSPAETEKHTRACLAAMDRVGRHAPIHYQEPFRRGYGDWQPNARDFLEDLRGAVAGGAAGWCLHNGSVRDGGDGRPFRSFDLRTKGLFEQLDAEEMAVVRQAATLKPVWR
jgi:hypothetical protein